MSADHPGQLLVVLALILLAGLLSSTEAALSSFSRTRAEELRSEGRAGSAKLLRVLDEQPRYLNSVLFLRMLAETAAIVMGTLMITGLLGRSWSSMAIAIGVMLVISFVFVGVAPRTLGRQHAESVALLMVGVVVPVARILGPLPRLLILIGNAITPGRGFSEGPFASEAELRELVDLAEASQLIESDERAMIHSVFELGDTSVREVMVPRTDVVFIERNKTLRQAMSLFLRTGYSRVPVIDDDLDFIVGFAYLKDISRRVFDRQDAQTTEQVESLMRPVLHVPDSKPADDLLREMQARRRHIAVVVDEYGGTAGIVTIEDILEEIVGEITDEFDTEEAPIEPLPDGSTRVSSRYPVDDLVDAVGVEIDDEEVDSVGGLMAKHLGKVPIPGSVVEVGGLIFTAEEATGRRKKVGTVRIMPVPTLLATPDSAEEGAEHGS